MCYAVLCTVWFAVLGAVRCEMGSALFILCAVFCFLSLQCCVYFGYSVVFVCVSSVVFIVCRVFCRVFRLPVQVN